MQVFTYYLLVIELGGVLFLVFITDALKIMNW